MGSVSSGTEGFRRARARNGSEAGAQREIAEMEKTRGKKSAAKQFIIKCINAEVKTARDNGPRGA